MSSHLDADRSLSNSGVVGSEAGEALSVLGEFRGGCDGGGDESDAEELSIEESFCTGTQTPKFCCAYSSAVSSDCA